MFVGFILISISAVSLFTFSVISAFSQRHFLISLLILFINVLLLVDIFSQFKKELFHFLKLKQKDLFIIIFCVIGTILAYVINVYIGLGAIIVSLLLGIMFVYSYCHFGGAGGKLGTLAFASVITYKGIEIVFKYFLKKPGYFDNQFSHCPKKCYNSFVGEVKPILFLSYIKI